MKEHAGEKGLDEWTAGEYLDKLRLEQKNCLDMSFTTISAWGPNAAMCHYTASETEKSSVLKKGLYLVDSGASNTFFLCSSSSSAVGFVSEYHSP